MREEKQNRLRYTLSEPWAQHSPDTSGARADSADNGCVRNASQPGFGGSLVFWSLIALSFATFAPGILLPEWRNYQFVQTAEQAQTHRMNLLEKRIDEQRRLLHALRSDPAAISRLAQRDLRFHKHGEQAVEVWLPPAVEEDEELFVPKPVELPAPIARAARLLPELDYDSVFNDAGLRPFVLTLPVGLTVLSFWLFSGGLPERRMVDR